MSKRNRLTFYLRANIHAFPHSFGKRVNISGTYCNCSRWGARTKRGRKENKKVIELTNLSAGWRHQSTRRKHSKNQGKRAEMRQERGGGGILSFDREIEISERSFWYGIQIIFRADWWAVEWMKNASQMSMKTVPVRVLIKRSAPNLLHRKSYSVDLFFHWDGACAKIRAVCQIFEGHKLRNVFFGSEMRLLSSRLPWRRIS